MNGALNGSVELKINIGNFFLGGTGAASPWVHNLQQSADITFTSTTSVFTKSVTFDPNDLANFPATSLPYDTYTWTIADVGADIAVSSGLYVYGNSAAAFTVAAPTLTLPLILDTDFALVTVSETDLSSAGIRQNAVNTALTVQDGYYYGYINSNFADYTLSIVTTNNLGGSDTITNPVAYIHYNYSVTAETLGEVGISLALSNVFTLEDRDILAVGDDDLDGVPNAQDLCPGTREGAPVDANGCLDVIELDANEVTIKAKPGAAAGDQQELNGILYTVVDETMLRSMVANDEDVTAVVTTLVTDMNYLFQLNPTFNQNIASWDVSNVINMSFMFENTEFNSNISFWNVSNVTSMLYMFNNSPFNINIENWNVSKVINMAFMFRLTPFNQNIGSWDVSAVENMELMFEQSSFNQPIGNWDVSKVTSMNQMFQATPFNQHIGNWNVGNVTDMNGMFNGSSFDQNISNWDVSKVTNMYNMFANMSFNQDLSNWNVTAVTQCTSFSVNNTDWTLPKPNFTNCTP